jgi:hypothetical protein
MHSVCAALQVGVNNRCRLGFRGEREFVCTTWQPAGVMPNGPAYGFFPPESKAEVGTCKARFVVDARQGTPHNAFRPSPTREFLIAPATHCELADREGPSTEGAATILRWIWFKPQVLCPTWLQLRQVGLQDTSHTHGAVRAHLSAALPTEALWDRLKIGPPQLPPW